METKSLNESVVQNIETLLRWRGLTRKDLADRMRSLGVVGWRNEKAIRRLLDGESRIPVDRLVALALCLQTTVETLLTPGIRWLQENPDEWVPEVITVGNEELAPGLLAMTIDGDAAVPTSPIRRPERYMEFIRNEELNLDSEEEDLERVHCFWTSSEAIKESRQRMLNLLRSRDVEIGNDASSDQLVETFLDTFHKELGR